MGDGREHLVLQYPGKSMPRRGNSQCKVSEAGMPRDSQEATWLRGHKQADGRPGPVGLSFNLRWDLDGS